MDRVGHIMFITQQGLPRVIRITSFPGLCPGNEVAIQIVFVTMDTPYHLHSKYMIGVKR